MTKKLIFAAVLSLALCFAGIAMAQHPERDISPTLHPNLAAAQQFITNAWDKVAEAQHDNRYDMHGHAQKAKELLSQASHELKLAAEDANRR